MREDVHNSIQKYLREEHCLLNKSELARRYNCDRGTIDKYLKIQKEGVTPKRSSRIYSSYLDGYKGIIIDKVDKHAATAMSVYKFIEKKGYKGKYSTVAAFVKKHKDNEVKTATIRFETTPGLQAQVDWKESLTMINKYGEVFIVNIFLMVLGYSRLKFVKLTTNRSQDTLFHCMIEGFRYFEGIPNEILFDNMKTVVNRNESNFKQIVLNKSFKSFADDAGFKPITCRPYRPKTKGKVEALAKLTSRLTPYNEEFETYVDLENIVNEFMFDINNEISQATGDKPIERHKKEQEYLLPHQTIDLLLSYISYQKEYKVSKESMVNYKGKKYSVPTKFIGNKVTITEEDNGSINIYYSQDIISCHQLSDKKYNYQKVHLHEILKSDALKSMPDDQIDKFIKNNLSMMDIFLGE